MTMMGEACAKFILLGEHAVVYGQPAIACPIKNLSASVSVQPYIDGVKIFSVLTQEEFFLTDLTLETNEALPLTVLYTLEWLKEPLPNCLLTINSDIPIASGLGSGTAVTLALIRALANYLNYSMSVEDENHLVDRIEGLYHGQPSGIDSKVIAFEQLLLFQKGLPPSFFNLNHSFHFLVADTGISHSTKEVVAGVKERYLSSHAQYQAIFEYIGVLVQQGFTALQTGDHQTLGQAMTDNHDMLKRLAVSNDMLDELVQVALQAGAMGAKLSGAGQGGSVIALVTEQNKQKISSALKRAGAKNVYDVVFK